MALLSMITAAAKTVGLVSQMASDQNDTDELRSKQLKFEQEQLEDKHKADLEVEKEESKLEKDEARDDKIKAQEESADKAAEIADIKKLREARRKEAEANYNSADDKGSLDSDKLIDDRRIDNYYYSKEFYEDYEYNPKITKRRLKHIHIDKIRQAKSEFKDIRKDRAIPRSIRRKAKKHYEARLEVIDREYERDLKRLNKDKLDRKDKFNYRKRKKELKKAYKGKVYKEKLKDLKRERKEHENKFSKNLKRMLAFAAPLLLFKKVRDFLSTFTETKLFESIKSGIEGAINSIGTTWEKFKETSIGKLMYNGVVYPFKATICDILDVPYNEEDTPSERFKETTVKAIRENFEKKFKGWLNDTGLKLYGSLVSFLTGESIEDWTTKTKGKTFLEVVKDDFNGLINTLIMEPLAKAFGVDLESISNDNSILDNLNKVITQGILDKWAESLGIKLDGKSSFLDKVKYLLDGQFEVFKDYLLVQLDDLKDDLLFKLVEWADKKLGVNLTSKNDEEWAKSLTAEQLREIHETGKLDGESISGTKRYALESIFNKMNQSGTSTGTTLHSSDVTGLSDLLNVFARTKSDTKDGRVVNGYRVPLASKATPLMNYFGISEIDAKRNGLFGQKYLTEKGMNSLLAEIKNPIDAMYAILTLADEHSFGTKDYHNEFGWNYQSPNSPAYKALEIINNYDSSSPYYDALQKFKDVLKLPAKEAYSTLLQRVYFNRLQDFDSVSQMTDALKSETKGTLFGNNAGDKFNNDLNNYVKYVRLPNEVQTELLDSILDLYKSGHLYNTDAQLIDIQSNEILPILPTPDVAKLAGTDSTIIDSEGITYSTPTSDVAQLSSTNSVTINSESIVPSTPTSDVTQLFDANSVVIGSDNGYQVAKPDSEHSTASDDKTKTINNTIVAPVNTIYKDKIIEVEKPIYSTESNGAYMSIY